MWDSAGASNGSHFFVAKTWSIGAIGGAETVEGGRVWKRMEGIRGPRKDGAEEGHHSRQRHREIREISEKHQQAKGVSYGCMWVWQVLFAACFNVSQRR